MHAIGFLFTQRVATIADILKQMSQVGWEFQTTPETAEQLRQSGIPSRIVYGATLNFKPKDPRVLVIGGTPRYDLVYTDLAPFADALGDPDKTLTTVQDGLDYQAIMFILAGAKAGSLVIEGPKDLETFRGPLLDHSWSETSTRLLAQSRALKHAELLMRPLHSFIDAEWSRVAGIPPQGSIAER